LAEGFLSMVMKLNPSGVNCAGFYCGGAFAISPGRRARRNVARRLTPKGG